MDDDPKADRVSVLKSISDDLVSLENDYGPGTVGRLLRHMAQQLNLQATQPVPVEELRKHFPHMYDDKGELLPRYQQPAAA